MQSSASVDDIASRNLTLRHQFEHALQLAEADDLVRDFDESSAGEVNRFGRVLAITDVASLDIDHAK